MQRLGSLDKWFRLVEGEAAQFTNERPRNVRIEVNAPVKVALEYIDLRPETAGEVHFLALVEGLDVIEFGSFGPFQLAVGAGEVMLNTVDGIDVSRRVIGAQPFTKIVERRRRDPQMEYMFQKMQENMQFNLARQAAEYDALFTRRTAALEAQLAATSAPSGAGSVPAPAENAGNGGTATEANGGGTNEPATTP